MGNGNTGAGILALVILALIGYVLFTDVDEDLIEKKKKIKKAIENLKVSRHLNGESEVQSGLKNSMMELSRIFDQSLKNMKEGITISNPISAGTLLRSCYEQSIILYISYNGYNVGNTLEKNELKMKKILGTKDDETSRKLGMEIESFMENDIRDTLNKIVHEPKDVEKIEQNVIKMLVGMNIPRFVHDVIMTTLVRPPM